MRSIEAYSYGCVMAVFPKPLADKVRGFAALIPDEDLYDDGSGEHGREDEPHVTVKYGLHTDKAEDVEAVIGAEPPAALTLGGMSAFHNDDYVVLKLDIHSPDLHRLNRLISDGLECTDTFPEYHPHTTIAYLKHRPDDPYWYQKLYSNMFKGEKVELDELLFSTADDDDYQIELKGSELSKRVAMSEMVAKRFTGGSEMNVGRELVKIARELLALDVGEKFENKAFRASRGYTTVRITDLKNAGKRGKKVETIALYNLDYVDNFAEWSPRVSFGNLKKERTFAGAKSWAYSLYEYLHDDNGIPVGLEERQERGVDVEPAGFSPIRIKTKYVDVEAGYKDFTVRDLVDTNNLPTCMPRFDGGKRDIKVFYRWVSDNKAKIKQMTYSDILEEMRKNGIKYHSYCAMD